MLPAPLWLALVRAMLVVDDGTRITPLSLHGEGGMKDKWERSSQVRRLREHPSAAARSPFPNGEGKEEAAWPPKKESQPRLATLGSPFQGKGLAWTLPPSYGRRCPEGAEVGWGYRYPRNKAFPAWGRWRAERAG